ncbi:Chaperone protein HscA [Klebsiella pneumoniae]|uniref:Chaperone protein HscA n=1 Tax=Klebsiella pneumoniae TaxID=573 RepID=A0A378ADW9_KLEPN|nr:Chaperone protein HscA [Klebsiella pneumoniae]
MALLQISEPGLSAAPHQRRLAAGIDLGTTILWWLPCVAARPRLCPIIKAAICCRRW